MTVIILHIIGAFVLLGAIIDNIIDTKNLLKSNGHGRTVLLIFRVIYIIWFSLAFYICVFI